MPAPRVSAAHLAGLHDAGGYLLLLDPDKRPLVPPHDTWGLDNPDFKAADLAAAQKHAAAGGLVGIIPASVGVVLVDVDAKREYYPSDDAFSAEILRRRDSVIAALGPPLSKFPSRSKGGHLLYRAPDGDVSNAAWAAGDVRGSQRLRGHLVRAKVGVRPCMPRGGLTP